MCHMDPGQSQTITRLHVTPASSVGIAGSELRMNWTVEKVRALIVAVPLHEAITMPAWPWIGWYRGLDRNMYALVFFFSFETAGEQASKQQLLPID